MARKLNELDVAEELIEAFKVFDTENNGVVHMGDIRQILTKVGEPLPKEMVEDIMKQMDPESTKHLKYKDYVKGNWQF